MITKTERKHILESIEKAGKQNLLEIKAPVNRRIMINNGKTWIHYLPDFDRFSINFLFYDLWKKIPETLNIKTEIEIEEIGKGVIVTKYYSKTFPELVKEKIKKDPYYIDFLSEKYQNYKGEIDRFIDRLKYKIKLNSKEYYNANLNFASLILDKIFPENLLERKLKESFNGETTNLLHKILTPYSVIPVMQEIHEGLVSLAEQEIYGEKPNINWFINNIGYYGRYNLSKAELEYEDNVRTRIEGYVSHYKTPSEIIKEKEDILFRKRVSRIEYYKTLEKIRNLNGKDKLVEKLSNFAGVALDFNENRRKVITRMFKYFSENSQRKF